MSLYSCRYDCCNHEYCLGVQVASLGESIRADLIGSDKTNNLLAWESFELIRL